LVKIQVKWKNSDDCKMLEVQNGCLSYGSMELCT